jgi:cystathionine gamma-synthase
MSDSVTTLKLTPSVPLGHALPLSTPYAVSVSLPTWTNHVDYWLGEKTPYVNTYPRLFPHRSVREVRLRDFYDTTLDYYSQYVQLASILARAYGSDEEKCLPFPTRRAAEECCAYMQAHSINAHFLSLIFCPDNKPENRILLLDKQDRHDDVDMTVAIYIVLFPPDQVTSAHTFWYLSGSGISVRQANHYLSMLGHDSTAFEPHEALSMEGPALCADGLSAKHALRRRIASGLLKYDTQLDPKVQQGSSDAMQVTEEDVFLFPSGMTAIWSAHQLALQVRPVGKSVCFGFVSLSSFI